jgi:hypothetical protein
MSSTAKALGHRSAFEQDQQSLERAAVVRSLGKSASIKSISDSNNDISITEVKSVLRQVF